MFLKDSYSLACMLMGEKDSGILVFVMTEDLYTCNIVFLFLLKLVWHDTKLETRFADKQLYIIHVIGQDSHILQSLLISMCCYLAYAEGNMIQQHNLASVQDKEKSQTPETELVQLEGLKEWSN